MASTLNSPVLVLNKMWIPITVTSARKAIVKVMTGSAFFLEEDSDTLLSMEEWMLLSPREIIKNNGEKVSENYISLPHNEKMRIPQVIVVSYNKFLKREVKLTRHNLLIRDGFSCQYTGKKIKAAEATIDHVVPQSRGGKSTWENLVIASIEANRKKADKTPQEAGMTLLKQPKKPEWHPLYSKFIRVVLSGKMPGSWTKYIDKNWIDDIVK